MLNETNRDSHRPKTSLTRCQSDFRRLNRYPVILYSSTCCTCCCCLHWVTAAVGGVHGFALAGKKYQESIDAGSKSSHRWAFWTTAAVLTAVLTVATFVVLFVQHGPRSSSGESRLELALLGTAFIPSIFFLPCGLVGLITLLIRKRSQPDAEAMSSKSIDYACRVIWMSFWYSTLGGAFGYLLMVLFLLLR